MSTGFSIFLEEKKKQSTVNGQLPKEAKYQALGFEQGTGKPGGTAAPVLVRLYGTPDICQTTDKSQPPPDSFQAHDR
ncbi:hypothetical protein [uncultured Acidaminococcus sp.]|uniref:hypothetical protein n=1 Tax=uncultured Acidaminococcus sp. TaxID=352152 RepID=UPI0029439462|nr:hypothetical protein [uncultured Acidaminococcus sp.]